MDEPTVDRLPRGGRADLEVINLGVPGYNSSDVAASVDVKALPLDPDLVIWTVVLNDPPSEIDPRMRALAKEALEALQTTLAPHTGLARYSRLAELVHERERQARLDEKYRAYVLAGFEAETPSWIQFRADLEHQRDALVARGIPFLVTIFPLLQGLDDDYAFHPAHARIQSACAELDIPCLDLLPAFLGQRDQDLWVHAKDQHPNPRGHELAAEALAAYLAAHPELLQGPPAGTPR